MDLGCSEEILTILAMLSAQNIFYRPKEKQAQVGPGCVCVCVGGGGKGWEGGLYVTKPSCTRGDSRSCGVSQLQV